MYVTTPRSLIVYISSSFVLSDEDFKLWLEKYKMGSYYAALEEEGYDAVESLILLSDEEIGELCTAIKMKPGHTKRFPVVIAEAREEEKKRRMEKEKKERMEKEREENKERMEKELADIETERKLAKARSTRHIEEESEVEEKENSAKADTNPKSRHFSFTMPPGKNHFAFLSHKKTNSKLGGNTETLALRVRALLFLALLCSHKACSRSGQGSYGKCLGLAVVLRSGQFEADYK